SSRRTTSAAPEPAATRASSVSCCARCRGDEAQKEQNTRMTIRLAAMIPLLAAAAFARDLPNYDASTAARVEPSVSIRAASGVKIPVEWYPQYGTPSFVWMGGGATSAEVVAMSADMSGAYVSEVHDLGRGPIIVRYRQRIDGIDVFRNELNVVMARDNRVVAVSGHLADRPSDVRAQSVNASSLFCIAPLSAADGVLAEIDGGTS